MTCRTRLVLILVPVLGLPAAGCGRSQSAQAEGRNDPAKPVKIDTVRQQTIRRPVEVVGTLAAVEEATVSSEADGVVSRILVDLGDRVRANEPMVELDHEKAQYNLDQQQAALTRALARYGASSPDRLPSIEQTPDVQKARAELDQARQAYDRAVELQKRQLIPKQTLDDADALLRARQASYDSALQNAKNLSADIDLAEANVKLAARQLRDATIRAPFDGYVQQRLVNPGQLVKAPMPIMSLVRVDPLKVTGEIPERLAPWIQVGQPVTLSVDAYPDRTITGHVSRISPAVDTQTRAFPFEALVPNGSAELKPGTFARVHIETAKVDPVLTLPHAALQYRYGVNRVFVVNGDRLAIRELKIGDRLGDLVEVLSGVKAGERVAVTDVEKLADRQRVTVDHTAE